MKKMGKDEIQDDERNRRKRKKGKENCGFRKKYQENTKINI